MPDRPVERKLTAILAADVAGYSRLMGADEEGTHARLRAHSAELVHPKIEEHRGRVVKNTGDGFLAEFPSVVNAVRCAVEMQRGMAEGNAGIAAPERIEFRIGINLGDVIAEEHDIFGDGVNVAARLEALAEPGGICISGTVHDHIGDRLPYTFVDMGEQSVKNIARPVRVCRIVLGEQASPSEPPKAASAKPPLPLPDKPSIVVLPFQNMSGDPEQEYFADGMVEEIITALSRIRWLFVIARNSGFTYKGQAVDVKRIGRELGVRYVLEGSVRKSGNRVRITAQLINAQSGTHLWADRFEGSLEDVFDLQDRVASSVAGVIEPALQAAEIQRSSERPTSDLHAYDLYLRALPHIYAWEKERTLTALDLLGQAIEHDPSYKPALGYAAYCYLQIDVNGWTDDWETNRRKAVILAERSVRPAHSDPGVIANAALVLGYFGEEIGAAVGMIERSLAVNPSFARGWLLSGWLRLFAGQTDLAINHFETSARLSPQYEAVKLSGIGQAHFFNRQFEDALQKLLMAGVADQIRAMTYRFLASCYAHTGRLEDAREIVKRLQTITPVVVPSIIPYRKPEHRELFLSGLRLAAGETT
jgi:TolB-like protein/class 3 adenylate cyclase